VVAKLVVKYKDIHALVVLPRIAACTLNPWSFGCEVVVATDAAANVVFVFFFVRLVVRKLRCLEACFLCFLLLLLAFGHVWHIGGFSIVSECSCKIVKTYCFRDWPLRS
jgi:hypothetical protein